MKQSFIFRRLATMGLAVLAITAVAPAEAGNGYPERSITVVMPYTAGGPTDVAARTILKRMGDVLGQNLVVENRPGGGATIGAQHVARAKPDGYTLLAGVVANMVTNPLLKSNVGYDPLTAFEPVALLSSNPLILVASRQSGFKTFAEVLQHARSTSEELAIASYGNGTPSHLAIELLKSTTGIKLNHVPYNGSAAAQLDVLGGRVPLLMDIVPSHLKNMEQGLVVGLGVGQSERSTLAPNVPTFQEMGLKSFEATTWFGLVAPAGTPKAIVERLNAAAHAALDDADVRKSLLTQGMAATWTTAQGFGDVIRGDFARWRDVIQRSGIKLQ